MAIAYLTRRTTFCASHRLHAAGIGDEENRRIFGKCNNPNGHGHNYILHVTIRGEIDPRTGMILNLTDLKAAIEAAVVDHVDHKHLNEDVAMFRDVNPTAEMMAVIFWRELKKKLPPALLYEIRLEETENNVAVYRGE